MIVLGVNTGTSADAVDAAAFLFDGGDQKLLAAASLGFSESLKKAIMSAVENPGLSVEALFALRGELTQVYIQVIKDLLASAGLKRAQITAIGLHGQTIHHYPRQRYPYTIQLADAASVACEMGCPVIENFRQSDMAVGGEGAPLIPAYHRYLAQKNGLQQCLFLNLGGIANITYVNGALLRGWDAGPANALLDFWVGAQLQQSYDDGGRWAASGKIQHDLLTTWLQDPYFALTPPKSTGRDYFSGQWLLARLDKRRSGADVQATLCELTVSAVVSDVVRYTQVAQGGSMYLFGKGVKNVYLVERLRDRLPDLTIQDTCALGVDPDWLESGLFAWLAHCRLCKKEVDLTSVTGAKRPVVLGAVYHGAS